MQFLTLPIRMFILGATFSAAAALPTQSDTTALQGREPSDFGLQWQEGPGSVHRARSPSDEVSPLAEFAVERRSTNGAERAASEVLNRRLLPGFLKGGTSRVLYKQAKAEKLNHKAGAAEIREMQSHTAWLKASKSQKDDAYRWMVANEQRAGELRQKANAAKASAARAAQKQGEKEAKKAQKKAMNAAKA
ncbi:hypothetical protein HYFRA_00007525 [Hymenoscyphus fraxineus]|uniref:Uncharacterized protein n=1 Tax=Hymenoscyphus fraxineus TaxID=746836 RepID=A0A9N9KWK1_9HELO|nr:hypothetical protein HYFRA_00007525 [Hymenoscyphus fraxineus]